MKPAGGILLYSGGLDSLIASSVLLDQGIKLTGVHFILPFTAPDADPEELNASRYARRINLPLIHIRCGREYMDIIENPRYGYGRHVNPCLDCKIYFLKKAAEIMRASGASFVATGEVLGQRPMSQMRNSMRLLEKESGIEGRLLRPLCALHLEPTIPEREGIVNRNMLLNISGRGRREQMDLAEKYGIDEYESPSGGCLFADRYIAGRVRDLLKRHPDYSMTDVYLLSIGRHFRISRSVKFVVSRNEAETLDLFKYRDYADCFLSPDFKGPSMYVKGPLSESDLTLAASVITRYGKRDSGPHTILIEHKGHPIRRIDAPPPVDEHTLDAMRL